jgi:plastocyanin
MPCGHNHGQEGTVPRSIASLASIATFAAIAMLVTAACTSGPAATATEPAGPHINVTAKDYAYEPAALDLEADQTNLIYFTNKDIEDHNIVILPDKDTDAPLWSGALIGRGSTVYEVTPMPAGEYYFTCKLHPVMNGPVRVGS